MWRIPLAAIIVAGALMAGVFSPDFSPAQAQSDSRLAFIVEPSFLPQSWGYDPEPLELRVGELVTWVNLGAAPHTVTDLGGAFDSGILLTGESWSYTPWIAGTFSYFCILHPDMRATLVVSE